MLASAHRVAVVAPPCALLGGAAAAANINLQCVSAATYVVEGR